MNNGYIEVLMPDHPYARKNGTILQHRLVAEKKLGRYLKKTEVVHHLDENRANNVPENLVVFRTNSDHARFHKIGIMQDMNDETFTCPIPNSRIKKCDCCGKYFICDNKHKDKSITFCSEECYRIYIIKQFEKRSDRPTKDELKQLILNYPIIKIADMYGVTDNSIRKWCKKYGLPYKYNDIKELKPQEEERHRILFKNFRVHMQNDTKDILFNVAHDAVVYIKQNHAFKTPERNIQSNIMNAVKYKTRYYGYSWELLPEE